MTEGKREGLAERERERVCVLARERVNETERKRVTRADPWRCYSSCSTGERMGSDSEGLQGRLPPVMRVLISVLTLLPAISVF